MGHQFEIRKSDVYVNLSLSLTDAFYGRLETITVPGCEGCGGTGRRGLLLGKCEACDGTGGEQKLKVNFPSGLEDGTRIRLQGAGLLNRLTRRNGDIYIFVKIAPDQHLQRHGADLYRNIDLAPDIAVRGGPVEVKTIDGPIILQIPPGTATGTRFKLKGKVMPFLNSRERGDLYVRVKVAMA